MCASCGFQGGGDRSAVFNLPTTTCAKWAFSGNNQPDSYSLLNPADNRYVHWGRTLNVQWEVTTAADSSCCVILSHPVYNLIGNLDKNTPAGLSCLRLVGSDQEMWDQEIKWTLLDLAAKYCREYFASTGKAKYRMQALHSFQQNWSTPFQLIDRSKTLTRIFIRRGSVEVKFVDYECYEV